MLLSSQTRATSSPCASRCQRDGRWWQQCDGIGRCVRFRVAIGEYDPHAAGSASSAARLVVAASSRLAALVADLRQVGASCGLGAAHEAAHDAANVASARGMHAATSAQRSAPNALVGAKLGVERQAAVDAIAAAKCVAAPVCLFFVRAPFAAPA